MTETFTLTFSLWPILAGLAANTILGFAKLYFNYLSNRNE
jgi:hypothetical protein